MIYCERYHLANTIEDALRALAEAPESARILSGGTDLLLDIQQGRHPPVHTLVDITNIPEMAVLEIRGDELFIGAGVPHNKIVKSSLIQEHAEALGEACGLIGGPQVRNVATLGGNVAHALPAADGTIALMALGAEAEIASLDGRRVVALADLFKGPGQSALDPQKELLAGFYLPLREAGQGSAFHRVMRPQGVAIAILNCAVWLQAGNDMIEEIRIAIGPSGPTPRRLKEAEKILKTHPPTQECIHQAYQAVLGEVNLRNSRHRATSDYRKKITGVLLTDSVRTAWKRAKEAAR